MKIKLKQFFLNKKRNILLFFCLTALVIIKNYSDSKQTVINENANIVQNSKQTVINENANIVQNSNFQLKLNHVQKTVNTNLYQYLERYDKYKQCTVDYQTANFKSESSNTYDYSLPADESLHNKQIVRGFLFYFQRSMFDHFIPEFRWVYRSWVEMLKSQPKLWRTDLVVFIDLKYYQTDARFKVFEELGCRFNEPRKDKDETSMCLLVHYVGLKDRVYPNTLNIPKEQIYEHLYNTIDIFSDHEKNLEPFYVKLKEISHYGYVDSILVMFDTYKITNDYYDFVLRSDIDIFITPLFAKWLPRYCNDFILGNGGYTTPFNTKRLGRIAKDLGMKYAAEESLGSTWYSTPSQSRLVAYLTLVSMTYLNENEFTGPERKSEVGTINWPDWHYGVLLYYGQHLAVNHLWATKTFNFVKLPYQFDMCSTKPFPVENVVHIHQYHSSDLFSKFRFKEGVYDNMNVTDEERKQVRYYCLSIALESKRLTLRQLRYLREKV